MIIKTLVENTTVSQDLKTEHGLSLYIETKKHKLLFDTGASSIFAQNANKLKVNLKDVEFAVISHGHYDHGGGLETFLYINSKAKVYINRRAFGKFYAHTASGEKKYIGLKEDLISNERLVFTGEQSVIDDGLELFSNVLGRKLFPSGNRDLFMKIASSYVQDDFSHEQNLTITEDNKKVLIAGCAHNGIVNILEHYYDQKGYFPTHVIGGLHLYNSAKDTSENESTVLKIAEFLLATGANYYTCHCTGLASYNKLKTIMGEKINYLSTGSQLNL